MATLTIKHIPEKLLKRLKNNATHHRRSINSEAICCLEIVLGGGHVDPKELLARVRSMRERMPHLYLNEKDLRAAKNEGRL